MTDRRWNDLDENKVLKYITLYTKTIHLPKWAFDQLEAESGQLKALRELQDEIEPHALHLEPDVVMYKATPNLSSLADWVERFLTIMRSPRR